MDEIRQLRDAHDAVAPPRSSAVTDARARLHAAFEQPERRPRPGRGGWRAALTVSLATAAAAVIALVGRPDGRDGVAMLPSASAAVACASPGPAASCTAALGRAAAADRALAAHKVFYRRNLFSERIAYIGRDGRPHARQDPAGFAIVGARPEELWLAADRSGRLSYGRPRPPMLPSRADHARWQAAGRPSLEALMPAGVPGDLDAPRTFTPEASNAVLLGVGELNRALPPSGDPLRGLSVDPAELTRQLHHLAWFQRVRVSGDGPCAEDLHDCDAVVRRNIADLYATDITTLLRYPLASAALRRSLLIVMGQIPGTRRLGTLTDPAGRRGAAIRLPKGANDGIDIVIFDLRTGRLLANGTSADGTIAALRVVNLYDLQTAAVDRIGQRP